jgi:coenzyme PQQ precursor peptide PqqA
MEWSKPEFVEITLGMEVTAYVNTDDKSVVSGPWPVATEEEEVAASLTTDNETRSTDD